MSPRNFLCHEKGANFPDRMERNFLCHEKGANVPHKHVIYLDSRHRITEDRLQALIKCLPITPRQGHICNTNLLGSLGSINSCFVGNWATAVCCLASGLEAPPPPPTQKSKKLEYKIPYCNKGQAIYMAQSSSCTVPLSATAYRLK
jgi:hypothetical protein